MSSPPVPISPYKGLVPYSEEDAHFFFGREADREIIEANLIASRLTLLYGASGVGKSSVLRAGVAHHLRALTEQNLQEGGKPEFIVIVFASWRDEPIDSLMIRIQDAIFDTYNAPMGISTPRSSMTETLQAWTQSLNCDLLIILDQFEEYFLYHPSEEGNAFDIEFPRAINRSDLRANFLISIREDELAKLDRFKGRLPNLFSNYLRLEHLDFDAARDAITKPIDQYNHIYSNNPPITIEPLLVDTVLEQVKTGELVIGETGRGATKESMRKAQVETPYLQLVMTRLWNEEFDQNSRMLRLETLERLGGAQFIVSTHLDRVMNRLSIKDRPTAAIFFQYLVTPSGSKIAHSLTDLTAYSGRSKVEVEHILKTLEEERVIRHVPPPIDHPDTARYEIYHDVLAVAILDWRSRFVRLQKTRKDLVVGYFLVIVVYLALFFANIRLRHGQYGNIIVIVIAAIGVASYIFLTLRMLDFMRLQRKKYQNLKRIVRK